MKCPKCGYNSFEFMDTCKKCNGDLVAFKQSCGIRSMFLATIDKPEEAAVPGLDAAVLQPVTQPGQSKDEQEADFGDLFESNIQLGTATAAVASGPAEAGNAAAGQAANPGGFGIEDFFGEQDNGKTVPVCSPPSKAAATRARRGL